MPMNLHQDLAAVLNKHSAENESNTPDFILADYLFNCLAAFDRAMAEREKWYGHQHVPGRSVRALEEYLHDFPGATGPG
jgi:hypothetical protein